MAEFMLLLHESTTAAPEMSAEEMQAIIGKYQAWGDGLEGVAGATVTTYGVHRFLDHPVIPAEAGIHAVWSRDSFLPEQLGSWIGAGSRRGGCCDA